ncbi:ATP-dependent DNA helicase [Clostridium sp. D33t1_170424_F3]|uniref:ATP-dependent DNA helicase n=1 Tax=Clostridium sp. D33t1_170424_F3 TaxID=2787099 RepID=UPI0018A94C6C|nr:ATP-dependent DNA helicase [Clostridium sp. D33t1_170424_F3]
MKITRKRIVFDRSGADKKKGELTIQNLVKVSVKNLVEFLLRSGSLDNRFGGVNRADEGARIHRKLQKAGGEGYQAEVFLSHTVERYGITYQVEGRADGVLTNKEGIVIDEIKTTLVPLERITEDFNHAHWGQAMCYAYFYVVQHQQERIAVQLRYYHVDTDQIKEFQRTFMLEELQRFYFDLLDQYRKWAQLQQGWLAVRKQSIQELNFPFSSYRAGQRQLAAAVYRTIAADGMLFCQAPTGIGKTMSTLFPAIKAMGEDKTERIFYLTAKTITRQVAEDALLRMREKGLRLKTITLTAKDKICFLEERNCNPEACPYADGYYDRVNDALYDLLEHEEAMTRQTIACCAETHKVCPFELALDVSLWCDAVIGDYNYLFDPVVYLKRFFSGKKEKYVFLIDEAHNLVDRSRSMYSALLSKAQILEAKRLAGKENKRIYQALGKVNAEMLSMRKQCEELGQKGITQKDFPKELVQLLHQFVHCMEEWMERHRGESMVPEVLQCYFDARFFLKITELYDDHYLTYIAVQGSEVRVKLLCMDPSALLRQAMERGSSSILFSATFSPLDYFASVLGGDEVSKKYALPSPFDAQNLGIFIAGSISTKYNDREKSLRPIADMLYAMMREKRGNYMAYFPSYRYMNDVHEVFRTIYPQVRTLLQSSGMREAEREQFLEQFDAAGSESLLGFCVLGGVYAEGVDLQGDRLIGTAIIGVGLPQISVEQNILRDYYDQVNGMGFPYAYQYPGMNKVQQAAGRVIRGESERGVILLIDSRFTTGSYRALFPPHWQHAQYVRNREELCEKLREFW